jgi:hypothetical protein|tara:strand:- start:3174 stop:4250 length:1077 start_codon:yes stop_codon:yes gene_type:complete
MPNKNLALPPKQTSASAWIGNDLAKRCNEWLKDLTPADISELERAAEPLVTEQFNIGAMTKAQFKLPNLSQKLTALRGELISGRGFSVLRGLPVGNYSEREAATIFYGVGTHLGLARSQNAAGHVLGHVRNLGTSSNDPNVRIYQTTERQTFHTDSTDVVGLICLQPAKSGGLSQLVSAQTIYNEMLKSRPDLLKLLLQPIATDRRGEVPDGMLPYLMIPVFSWFKNYLTPFYQRQYIDSAQRFDEAPRLTENNLEALNYFDNLANQPDLNLPMQLETGDMQFVYNHALLHDRTTFVDWPEFENKRHLLRLWLSIPGDRPLPVEFATRFGSVEVGNRGGIVVPGSQFCVPWTRDLAKA